MVSSTLVTLFVVLAFVGLLGPMLYFTWLGMQEDDRPEDADETASG